MDLGAVFHILDKHKMYKLENTLSARGNRDFSDSGRACLFYFFPEISIWFQLLHAIYVIQFIKLCDLSDIQEIFPLSFSNSPNDVSHIGYIWKFQLISRDFMDPLRIIYSQMKFMIESIIFFCLPQKIVMSHDSKMVILFHTIPYYGKKNCQPYLFNDFIKEENLTPLLSHFLKVKKNYAFKWLAVS